MIFPLNRLFFLDSQESPNKEMIVLQRQTFIAKDFFQTYMKVELTFYRRFRIGSKN